MRIDYNMYFYPSKENLLILTLTLIQAVPHPVILLRAEAVFSFMRHAVRLACGSETGNNYSLLK